MNSLTLNPDSVTVEKISSSPTTPAPDSQLVPGWGIALLVLASLILLLLIIILIIIVVFLCRRRRSSGYYTGSSHMYMNDMADIPMYSTHSHFEAPSNTHNPYSNAPRNGNAGYTNKAMDTNNL
ncbi:mucin-1 isoform X3 [Amia ocellicauda]